MTEPNPNGKNVNEWIGPGILIAIIPWYAYLVSYFYESGYASVFELPSELISINLTQVFSTLSIMSIFMFLFVYIKGFLERVLTAAPPIIQELWRPYVIFLVMVIFNIYNHWSRWLEWIILLNCLVLWIFLDAVFPLLTQRDKKSYVEKWQAQQEIEKNERKSDKFITFIYKSFGMSGPQVLVYSLLILLMAHSMGRAKAFDQVEFYVTSSGNVVLGIYNDTYITCPFNERIKEVHREFTIIKPDSNRVINITLKKIGPLRLEEKPADANKLKPRKAQQNEV